MNVFDRIDSWLKENNISRRKLAIMANLAPSSLQSALTRRNKMSYDTLDALSRAMGLSVDFLLYGTTAEDLAFETLEMELSDYGYSISYDDSEPGWCYVYPSVYGEEPTFILHEDAKYLPVSFIESELKSAIADGHKIKVQYVQNRIKNSIETASEIHIGQIWESGDL